MAELDPSIQDEETPIAAIRPSAEEMLERLKTVDLSRLDLKTLTEEAKGNQAWVFILTMPVSALILVIGTLLGSFITGYFIASFIASAAFIFVIGQMLDQYERKFKRLGRLEAMRRIGVYEGEIGLLYHFHDFLPSKYRHLWQSVRRKNYIYTEQYITAIRLLQNKLDHGKFTYIWQLKYPQTISENPTEASEENKTS